MDSKRTHENTRKIQADGDSDAALEYVCCLLIVNYWRARGIKRETGEIVFQQMTKGLFMFYAKVIVYLSVFFDYII